MTLKIAFVADQARIRRGCDRGRRHEGVIAAALTGLMILLFLGSWRST